METAKSDFEVQVIRIPAIVPHPKADTLDLVEIFGSTAIIKRGTFRPGDWAVYVPVDAMVPTARPEFAFLAKEGRTHARIKAMKLRGIFSMGLIVPVPLELILPFTGKSNLEVGQDVAQAMGIERYVSPADRANMEGEGGPSNRVKPRAASKGPKLPVYGLDPLRKYSETLQQGEEVIVTEKIHGTNARFVFTGGRLWVGSHKMMRGCSKSRVEEFFNRVWLGIKSFLGVKHRAHLLQELGDVWWQTATKYELKKRLSGYPDMVLYGEIYGRSEEGKYVQTESGVGFGYDTDTGSHGLTGGLKLRVFDVYDLKRQRFLDWADFSDFVVRLNEDLGPHISIVPMLDRCFWSPEVDAKWRAYADAGQSVLTHKHIGEGVVIKPALERNDPRCGRVALKFAGEKYHMLRAKEG